MQSPRRLTGRLIPLTAAGALAGGLLVAPPAAADEHTTTIDIVGINDFHGRVEADGAAAGAAVLSGYVNSVRATNPNTLFVSAGDNIGASTFTSFISDDRPTLDVLNAMGLDVSALGNHEFDLGRADVDDRVLDYANFPHLGANIYDRATGLPAYDEYFVKDVDGVRVGFIGVNTEALPSLVSPSGIESLRVGSMLEATNRVAAQLSDGDEANGEADVVVLLVHEGPPQNTLASATGANIFGNLITGLSDDVHAVFSGHTHLRFAHQIPVDGWAAGVTRPVVMGGQYGEAVARVTLEVDRASKELVSTSSQIVPLRQNLGTSAAPNWISLFDADPAITPIVAEATATASILGAAPLGEISADIRRALQSNGTTENRGGESTLGNLVADVQLWATQLQGSEIAFMNPGGLRQDLVYAGTGEGNPDGLVTYREAAVVQPFANTLVVMTLTGAQVIGVLEQQWQPTGESRPFLKLGTAGLTYTYDPTAPRGERIADVWVAGEPLDLDRGYRVVANSFLASGGDNFGVLAEGTDRADTGRVDLQAFVDYMAAFGSDGSAVSPDLAQRAVGITLPQAPATGYAPGDEVTVQLSSLLFSNAAGQARTVRVAVGDTELATAPLDATVVDATDLSGRATVTFTVPSGLTGSSMVVDVTVPGNGTAVSFALPLEEVVVPPSCVADFTLGTVKPRTFTGTLTFTNDSAQTLDGWQLLFTAGEGERFVTGKGAAKVSQAGELVTVTPQQRSATVAPGETVTVEVQGQHDGTFDAPTGFVLDGVACG
jgi:5'-nucleotidase